MSRLLKMVGLVALSGILMMAGGCGGGDDETPVVTPSNSFVATINANGSATTGASATTLTAPSAQGYLAGVSVRIDPNTVITAKNADGSTKALTSPLSLTFIAPSDSTATFSGKNGVPVPTGFTALNSTSGAVDIQLTGAASATFNPPITITMPVPGKLVGAVIKVYTVAGTTYTPVGTGSFTVATAGLVSFPISALSWKVCDPNPDPGAPTTTVQPTTVLTTTVQPTTTTTTATTTVQPTTTTVTTTISGSGSVSGGGSGF